MFSGVGWWRQTLGDGHASTMRAGRAGDLQLPINARHNYFVGTHFRARDSRGPGLRRLRACACYLLGDFPLLIIEVTEDKLRAYNMQNYVEEGEI